MNDVLINPPKVPWNKGKIVGQKAPLKLLGHTKLESTVRYLGSRQPAGGQPRRGTCSSAVKSRAANYVSIGSVSDDRSTPPSTQSRNPLHGMTLERILSELVAHFGWPGLGDRIPVRCFTSDPSIASSLKFLRKTPWARQKVEGLYLFMLREQRQVPRSGNS